MTVKDDLRTARRKKDLGPHTSIRLAADVDAWIRKHVRKSGMTYRGILEEGIRLYRQTHDTQP